MLLVCKFLLYNSNQRLYLDLRAKILICEAKNARVLWVFGYSVLEAFEVIKFSPLALYRICIYFRKYIKFKAQFRLHANLPFFERENQELIWMAKNSLCKALFHQQVEDYSLCGKFFFPCITDFKLLVNIVLS